MESNPARAREVLLPGLRSDHATAGPIASNRARARSPQAARPCPIFQIQPASAAQPPERNIRPRRHRSRRVDARRLGGRGGSNADATGDGDHPEQHLASYVGLMQADPYAGFNRLYEATRKPGPIVEAACWAHARRKFFDLAQINKAPIAIEAVERIDVLFAIEREINGMTPQERVRIRNERSRSLVSELERWLREQRARVSKNSETGKAIDYSLKRWSALTRFLDDGRLCMSNNAAERELRAIALGRRNWTFAGSDEGGRRAAAIYTLIATAKLNNVDPQAWLADVLARLPDHPAKRIHELLP